MENRQTALVTGGSRGIGKAIVKELVENGFSVWFTYHKHLEEAQKVLDELKSDQCEFVQCDLSDEGSIHSLFERLDEIKVHPGLVVNNAGIAEKHPLDLASHDWMEKFKSTVAANLCGPALISKLAIDRMKAKRSGVIVNISSRGAFRGEPEMPGYGASKAGLNSLTQSLAKAAGKFGISVMAVAPGFVATDMARELLSDEE